MNIGWCGCTGWFEKNLSRNVSYIMTNFRVKKPDEFNRPRIDPSDREIVRKKSFVSKKV